MWYGDCYLQFMGVPVALKEMADGGAAEEADSKFLSYSQSIFIRAKPLEFSTFKQGSR